MVYRFNAWLVVLCVSLFGFSTSIASGFYQSAATTADHFSNGVLKALYDMSLVMGVICLLLAADRFKKNKNSPQSASFSGAVIYAVFGVGLVILYFVA